MQYRGRFRGTPRSVQSARRAIVDYARACGFGKDDLCDIETAAGEALANALEHGNRFGGFIVVTCDFRGCMLTVEIRDQGQGFTFRGIAGHAHDNVHGAARGFGISIMHRLMDEVRFTCGGKHAVRLMKRLASGATCARRESEA